MGVIATMVVRVGATVDDLVKGMDKATKEVARTSDKIGKLGDKLTLGITAPALLAGGAMAKMAANAEATGRKIDRVFGDSAGQVKGFSEEMTRSIPKTTQEIEQLVSNTALMARGMGVSSEKAVEMSEKLVKMAGDISAAFGVPLEDALQALDKGLTGQGRGLAEFGLKFNQAQIKAEAFKMGILGTNETLSTGNTALVSYALMLSRFGPLQGEAARTAGDASKSFAFMKAKVEELSEKLGKHLLPIMISVVDSLNRLLDLIDRAPPGLVDFTIAMIALGATVGPVLKLLGWVGKLYTGAKALFFLGKAATSSYGIVTALSMLTAPEIIGGLAVLAAALYGVYKIWESLNSKSRIADALDHLTSPAGSIKTGKNTGLLGGASGATDENLNSKSPFDQFKDSASGLSSAFDDALAHGRPVADLIARMAALQESATGWVEKSGGFWTKQGAEAQRIADEMQRAVDLQAYLNSSDKAGVLAAIAARSFNNSAGAGSANVVANTDAYNADLGKRWSMVFDETGQRVADAFDAPTEAAIAAADGLNQATRAADLLSYQFSDATTALMDFQAGITRGVTQFAQQFAPGNIAERMMGSFFASAQSLFAKITGGGSNGFGGGIGSLIGSVIGGKNGGGLGRLLSGLVGSAGLGGSLGKLAGSLGGPLGTALGGALGSLVGGGIGKVLGGLFGHHKKKVDDSASALGKLADAANKVTEALTNVPTGFKIALARYEATQVGMPTSVESAGNGVMILNVDALHVNGVQDPEKFYDELVTFAAQNATRGGTSALSLALGR